MVLVLLAQQVLLELLALLGLVALLVLLVLVLLALSVLRALLVLGVSWATLERLGLPGLKAPQDQPEYHQRQV